MSSSSALSLKVIGNAKEVNNQDFTIMTNDGIRYLNMFVGGTEGYRVYKFSQF